MVMEPACGPPVACLSAARGRPTAPSLCVIPHRDAIIMKTHKTISKRFKITKRGKVLKRTAGQDHFNSRESGNVTRNKRRDRQLSESYTKTIKKLVQQQ